MDWIVVDGVSPYDGRYELASPVDYSTREWGWVKRFAGYLPLTLSDALDGGDAELMAVLALIALHRAGKVATVDIPRLWERLEDAQALASIRFDSDDVDEPSETQPDPPASSPARPSSSGDASTTSSETSELPVRNGSGTDGSAGAGWPLIRSET